MTGWLTDSEIMNLTPTLDVPCWKNTSSESGWYIIWLVCIKIVWFTHIYILVFYKSSSLQFVSPYSDLRSRDPRSTKLHCSWHRFFPDAMPCWRHLWLRGLPHWPLIFRKQTVQNSPSTHLYVHGDHTLMRRCLPISSFCDRIEPFQSHHKS